MIADRKYASNTQVDRKIYWEDFAENEDEYSVPEHIEQHADELRQQYISYIHSVSQVQINEKTLRQNLCLPDGLSYWWMTFLAEKNPSKSTAPYNCIRLFALEKILQGFCGLTIIRIRNPRQRKAIINLCQNMGFDIKLEAAGIEAVEKDAAYFYQKIPAALRCLLSLRHLVRKFKLSRLKAKDLLSGDDVIFFCSYFYHLDREKCSKAHFYSHQWEQLPEILAEMELRQNWLHHYLLDKGNVDEYTALKWLDTFNSKKDMRHVFIESYLTIGVLIKTINLYIRLAYIYLKTGRVSRVRIEEQGNASPWYFLDHDWKHSLLGPAAFNNCLWIVLFDKILSAIPHQKIGLYLWENEGWESAFVHAWKKNGHGTLIGVPHSTIRYWALNNFDPLQVHDSELEHNKPLPDKLAVNGGFARKMLQDSSYPEEKLVDVEAARYQYLNPASCKNEANELNRRHSSSGGKVLRILVLGEFTRQSTLRMLDCLQQAMRLIAVPVEISLKNHPACVVEKDEIELDFELYEGRLDTIGDQFDIAYIGNATSAGFDALMQKIVTIIFMDVNDFNMSPLRGLESVYFCGTSQALSEVINKNVTDSENRVRSLPLKSIFNLDPGFPLWKQLVESHSA